MESNHRLASQELYTFLTKQVYRCPFVSLIWDRFTVYPPTETYRQLITEMDGPVDSPHNRAIHLFPLPGTGLLTVFRPLRIRRSTEVQSALLRERVPYSHAPCHPGTASNRGSRTEMVSTHDRRSRTALLPWAKPKVFAPTASLAS